MNWHRVVDLSTVAAGLCAVILTAIFMLRMMRGDVPRLLTRPHQQVEDWKSYIDEGHWMGRPDASVVILEFGDYQCPACRGIQGQIEAIQDAYASEVAVVYRHWPLSYHTLAYPAARAAECAGEQGRFEEFHRWLYADSEWMANPYGRFIAFARRIEMADVDSFQVCLDSLDPMESIERDIAAAVQLEARGTPTILVNGLMLGTAADSATLAGLIDEILTEVDGRSDLSH